MNFHRRLCFCFFGLLSFARAGDLHAPETESWDRLETGRYSVQSRFWGPRIRHLVVNYVPFIVDLVENNKSQDQKKNVFARFQALGQRHAGKSVENPCVHNWAEVVVYNAFESMCWALTVDPQGDGEMIASQQKLREAVERWIPVLLEAQEPDGYLCTDVQMRGLKRFVSPSKSTLQGAEKVLEDRHEGYMMGYFIECGIAHYRATGGKDLRIYRAAKKGADLFVNTIGDLPKLAWQPDHEELEQAMARFSLLADEVEGQGAGDRCRQFAKWLVDNRGVTPPHTDGYRQKDKPLSQQTEPYGHAVMFGYLYAGAAEVARLTGDDSLKNSADRLWKSLVDGGKMYLTGAIGSRNEEFGKMCDLPNDALLGESCANIANLYFQQNMNLLHADAKYADVAEVTLYNGVLGSLSLDEPKWQYFNPLDQKAGVKMTFRQNAKSDCCMGNIPRTLLRLPTWIYAQSKHGITVNQYIGSKMTLHGIAGTEVEMVQRTDYPWDGTMEITVNPAVSRAFALRIRVPNRRFSELYIAEPAVEGIEAISLNGNAFTPVIEKGYVVLERTWKKGDRVEIRLPLKIQRVRADKRIEADAGRVALQYGPLIYNIESVDLPTGKSSDSMALHASAPLRTHWDDSVLGGILTVRGAFADGAPLMAIPHYARMNRANPAPECEPVRSMVWLKEASTVAGTAQSAPAR